MSISQHKMERIKQGCLTDHALSNSDHPLVVRGDVEGDLVAAEQTSTEVEQLLDPVPGSSQVYSLETGVQVLVIKDHQALNSGVFGVKLVLTGGK